MPRFLNNCRGYNHKETYGGNAFYDLYCTGGQAEMAADLKRGEQCAVATPKEDGDIVFVWFKFDHEKIVQGEDGESIRVFFGKRLRSETLSKTRAVKSGPYSVFFNIKGHFKRPSVIKPKG
jgi:hypothetical protein